MLYVHLNWNFELYSVRSTPFRPVVRFLPERWQSQSATRPAIMSDQTVATRLAAPQSITEKTSIYAIPDRPGIPHPSTERCHKLNQRSRPAAIGAVWPRQSPFAVSGVVTGDHPGLPANRITAFNASADDAHVLYWSPSGRHGPPTSGSNRSSDASRTGRSSWIVRHTSGCETPSSY